MACNHLAIPLAMDFAGASVYRRRLDDCHASRSSPREGDILEIAVPGHARKMDPFHYTHHHHGYQWESCERNAAVATAPDRRVPVGTRDILILARS